MKIGFLSLPLSGHLNPMTALARKLQMRGNEVVFFGVPDAEPTVRAAGLNFVLYSEKEYPVGSIAKDFAPVAKLHGRDVGRYSCAEINPPFGKAALANLPGKLAETGVEALVIDTFHFFVELVAVSMGIPYVHIWNFLPIDLSGSTPPCFFSWTYDISPEGIARNVGGVQLVAEDFGPVFAFGMSYAEKVGLKIDWSDPAATTSKLAVISQTPKEFDLPGVPWPAHFHYAGPFDDSDGREPVPFAWEKLTGKPLIYASLGTLVNGSDHVYKAILEAVAKLPDVQVVLSIGKNVNPDDLGPIPSNTIIVRSAPQIELLKRATLCITHAGLNTALESLAQGVPMVAIPIAYDQPGVAARIAHHGVGEFLNLEDLTEERLSGLIQKVLNEPSYRDKAHYFQKVIAETRGLDVAADVIEQAFRKAS
jgi:MGT family glycosyltransferase